MGQDFMLINIDKRGWTTPLGRLGCFSSSGYGVTDKIEECLDWPLSFRKLYRLSEIIKKKRSTKPTGFHKLPDEIIDMIFGEMTDFEDAICLAVTSSLLFHIGVPHIQALAERCASDISWEGCRMILAGDYSSDELPPGMLTDEEQAEYRAFRSSERGAEDGGNTGRLVEIAREWFQYLRTRRNWKFWGMRTQFMRGPAMDRFVIHMITNEWDNNRYCKDKSSLVIANGTKKEWIRYSEFQKDIKDWDPKGRVSVGDIISELICWSPGTGGDMEAYVRGPWAGNRLWLVNMEEFRDVLSVEERREWRDVTQEVAHAVSVHKALYM